VAPFRDRGRASRRRDGRREGEEVTEDSPKEDTGSGGGGWRALLPLLLLLLVVAVYGRTAWHDAVLFDDDAYLLTPEVKEGLSLRGVAWAFTAFHVGNWHPLTWLSHMLDVSLFGLGRPGAHHAESFLIHGASVLLLYRFLRAATGAPYRSLFAAALFAVHPMHVESVAWIAERKDLLAGFFFLLALVGWLRHLRAPSPGRYGAVLLALAASLLSKPMAVTFPFVLLLLDAWPLGRTSLAPPADGSPHRPAKASSLLLEKVPFLLLAAASSAVTFAAQGAAVQGFSEFTVLHRLSNFPVSIVRYLGKFLVPARLGVYYPAFPVGGGEAAAALLVLAAVTVLAVREARRRPFLPVGWFWFLGMLVPVSGLVQVGGQAMADRYAYLPYLGLYLAAAWGIPSVASRLPARRALLAAAGTAAVALLAAAAFVQAGYWKNSETLFLRTIEVTGPNATMQNNLGFYYFRIGEKGRAEARFREAVALRPDYFDAVVNLGGILVETGRPDEALPHALAALALRPKSALALDLLGEVRRKQGREEEAVALYRRALAADPADRVARERLGAAAGGAAVPVAPSP
jgi:hypothetical protein